jgi:hypothetical protein
MEWNFGLLKENTSTNECAHAIVCVAIRKGQIRNKVIHDRVGVTPIEKKLVQRFGHIQWRHPEAQI